jgi:ankyrin repeat protein
MKTITAIAILIGSLACLPLWAADPAPSGTALFEAIRRGDSAAVQKLLKGGADPEARNDRGDTPLMAAALNAAASVLELLLQSGADANAANQAGATALMRAATFEDKARLLLEKGADLNARSLLGNTALILAARKEGNSRTVKLLLDRGAEVNATNDFGATALMAAAAARDVNSVRLLLDRGADVNAIPNMNPNGFAWGGGRSALMWAAFYGDEPLLKLLLERGAKVNHFTVAGGALAQAGWGGHVGVAKLLLDAGAPIDQRDFIANYTPLHWAASSEHSSPALVKLLLARGADANAEGGQPVDNFLGVTQTPLSLARKRGDTPIVQALLKAGAKDAAPPARSERSAARTSSASGVKTVAEAIQRALPP